ncbi:hypothetical protein BH11ARM1_BH11ARM1_07060 [soil metagenome]
MDDILYGVVGFARGKPIVRALIFILAVSLTVLLVSLYSGTIKGYTGLTFIVVPAFVFVLPSVFRMALWSGKDFAVGYRRNQVKKVEEDALRKFEESKAAEDAVSLEEARLESYYEINQAQSKSIFKWAIGMMVVGSGTILTGIWIFYFKDSRGDLFMSGLSAAAGIVTNLISVVFLTMHHKTQDRALEYYRELTQVRRIQLALQIAANRLEGTDQTNVTKTIILTLLKTEILNVDVTRA